MTIEQTLKNDHETLRRLLRRLDNDDLQSEAGRTVLVSSLRAEWLAHTEAREAIVTGGIPFEIAREVANTEDRARIESLLAANTTGLKIAGELKPLFERQFEMERAQLVPVLRSTYSTAEREELGEIFTEAKFEIRESLQPVRARSRSWFEPLQVRRWFRDAFGLNRA